MIVQHAPSVVLVVPKEQGPHRKDNVKLNVLLARFLILVCHHVTSAPGTGTGTIVLAVLLVPMMEKLAVLEL